MTTRRENREEMIVCVAFCIVEVLSFTCFKWPLFFFVLRRQVHIGIYDLLGFGWYGTHVLLTWKPCIGSVVPRRANTVVGAPTKFIVPRNIWEYTPRTVQDLASQCFYYRPLVERSRLNQIPFSQPVSIQDL